MFTVVLIGTMVACTGGKMKTEGNSVKDEKQATGKVLLAQTPPLGWNIFDSYGIAI